MEEKKTLRDYIDAVDGIHEEVAERFNLKKAFVRCSECGYEKEVDGAVCMKHGWPKCCEVTMALVTEST